MREAIGLFSDRPACGCADALHDAIITPRDSISEETRQLLQPILGRYLGTETGAG